MKFNWKFHCGLLAISLLGLVNISLAAEPAAYGAAAGCVASDSTASLEFSKLVIRTMGIDGKACYESKGTTYCLSRTQLQPRPITLADVSADDRLRVLQGLFLCTSKAGTLGGCVPVQSGGWDCDHYGPGPKNCHCTGEQGCIALATLPTCAGGSCGNCSKGDCCCTAP